MESLLCNEVLQMSPNNSKPYAQENDEHDAKNRVFRTKEDCEEAFGMFLVKEIMYLPERGYSELVGSSDTIRNARFKSVNWLIKAHKRMNLWDATVFLAVNYLDRFISIARCRDWKSWMFDLLSVACISIASKFNETICHSLHNFQVDFVDACFAPTLIQRTELTVLKTLAWRINSITPFSYVHILAQSVDDLTKRATELLLCVILDPEFLEFKQCVVAMSAVRCALDQCVIKTSAKNATFGHLETFIPQDQKDGLIECRRIMAKLIARDREILIRGKKSPATVLKVDLYDF
ncbi:cyclin d [Striga asiatica]|uniref:Cyclin d n=1 Tax=Striga asiatica TaxID=4170 RepID=A0A5A7RA90_STRAF|nr:cyclin d [Striga asiatica]